MPFLGGQKVAEELEVFGLRMATSHAGSVWRLSGCNPQTAWGRAEMYNYVYGSVLGGAGEVSAARCGFAALGR